MLNYVSHSKARNEVMKKVRTAENNFLSFKDNTYIVEHFPQNPYFQRERKTLKKIIKTICIIKFFSTIQINIKELYVRSKSNL